jgi:hypothetical protein
MSPDSDQPLPQPSAETGYFNWRIFADATCAGLSTLMPLPGLDLLLELIFRRHMPKTITSYRNASLQREIIAELGRGSQDLVSMKSCLVLPVIGLLWFIKRLSRKILYFLTIREAALQLSSYWHRAYLVDHIIRSGHLEERPDLALSAFHQTMDQADTGSLIGIARQVMRSGRSLVRTLFRALRGIGGRRSGEQGPVAPGQWQEIEQVLQITTAYYERLYQSIQPPHPVPSQD